MRFFFVAAGLCLFVPLVAAPLPDRIWLEKVTLLAHSVRDQTVVLQLPEGDKHLLIAGEELRGVYDLKLVKVLDRRVELDATHGAVSDRKLKLWFDPTKPVARIVSSAPDESETPTSATLVNPPQPSHQDGDG